MSRHKTLHRQFTVTALRRGLSFLKNHPDLRRCILAIIRRLGLYPLTCTIYARMAPASCRPDMRSPYGFIPTDIAHLPPRARHIYADLKAAIERRQKENG